MWKSIRDVRVDSLTDWTPERLRRCDPYLVWAEASTDPVEPPPTAAEPLNIAVLVELLRAADYSCFLQRINGLCGGALHFLPSGVERGNSLFITGLVTRTGLKWLVDKVVNNGISRFTLQDPRDEFGFGGNRDSFYAQLAGISKLDKAVADELGQFGDAKERPTIFRPGTYLGVIDDGLPFARMRSLLGTQGAALRLWDQGWLGRRRVDRHGKPASGIALKPNDAYWRPALDWSTASGQLDVRGFFYGRRIKEQLSTAGTVQPDRRDAEYAPSQYFSPPPRYSHGAAVLGLMAPWLSGARQAVSWPCHISGLAMVQLPTRTVSDTSGGSLAMHVLDGLRFILWQESVDRPENRAPRPVAVNISYGVHAGPHDGSSMVERAMLEALCNYKHLHLVLPAGNAHRAGCHAQRKLAAHGEQASIWLRVLPDNAGDTFVEVWIPQGKDIGLSLRPPGVSEPFKINKGEAWIYQTNSPGLAASRTVHFGAVYPAEVAQGQNGTMVLVAIGSTRNLSYVQAEAPRGLNQQPRVNVSGQAGLWELVITNVSQGPITVDAWVERGDAPPDRAGGSRQAYFPDSCVAGLQPDNATPEGTLNGIATLRHERAHVVGAMRLDGRLSDYSAADVHPQPSLKLPEVVAPADWSLNVPGLRTLGFSDGAITRINGTSAACAVYTRALAVQLHEDPAQLPMADLPGDSPRHEMDCAPERQPKACDELRGQQRRMLFKSEIDPTLAQLP